MEPFNIYTHTLKSFLKGIDVKGERQREGEKELNLLTLFFFLILKQPSLFQALDTNQPFPLLLSLSFPISFHHIHPPLS